MGKRFTHIYKENNTIVHLYKAMVWVFGRNGQTSAEEHKLRLNGGHIEGRAQISLKVYRGEHIS